MSVISAPRGKGRSIKNSRSTLVTQRVRGQLGLSEILSEKTEPTKTTKSSKRPNF